MKAIAFGLRLVLAALLLLAASAAGAQERRVALVVGNAAYQHAPRLANAGNDAGEMAARLRVIGFEVELVEDAPLAALSRALRGFGDRAQGASVALLFFAGHGLQVARGAVAENYLVPVDARLTDVRDVDEEAVPLSRVLARMDGAGTRLVFLDACRDNPLAAQMRGQGAGRSMGRGLARIDAADRGTLIAFATDPNNIALDGSGANSPFTSALVEHIGTPGLDIRQVLSRVRGAVLAATGGRQTPYTTDVLVEDVILVPAAAPPQVQPPPADQNRAVEIAFWQAIQASRNPADFEAYLAQYPQGAFAALARNRLAELRPPQVASRPPPREEPAPLPTTTAENAAWQRAVAANTVAGFEEYLRAYPDATNSGAARRRLSALRQAALAVLPSAPSQPALPGQSESDRREIEALLARREALQREAAERERQAALQPPAGSVAGAPDNRAPVRSEHDRRVDQILQEQRERLEREAAERERQERQERERRQQLAALPGAPRGGAWPPLPPVGMGEQLQAFNRLVERARRANGVLQNWHGVYGWSDQRGCAIFEQSRVRPSGDPITDSVGQTTLRIVRWGLNLIWSENRTLYWVWVRRLDRSARVAGAPIVSVSATQHLTWTRTGTNEPDRTESGTGVIVTIRHSPELWQGISPGERYWPAVRADGTMQMMIAAGGIALVMPDGRAIGFGDLSLRCPMRAVAFAD